MLENVLYRKLSKHLLVYCVERCKCKKVRILRNDSHDPLCVCIVSFSVDVLLVNRLPEIRQEQFQYSCLTGSKLINADLCDLTSEIKLSFLFSYDSFCIVCCDCLFVVLSVPAFSETCYNVFKVVDRLVGFVLELDLYIVHLVVVRIAGKNYFHAECRAAVYMEWILGCEIEF